jgi:hypothetical protein
VNARALLVGAVWWTVFPGTMPAQAAGELREYARSVYAAEQGAGHLQPAPRDYMNTGNSQGAWARALAAVRPPAGYERLHATLVRNARIVASSANQVRTPPGAGVDACSRGTANASENCTAANMAVPQGAEQRLKAAIDQYFSARERLTDRLRKAGVTFPGWPGDVIRPPGS